MQTVDRESIVLTGTATNNLARSDITPGSVIVESQHSEYGPNRTPYITPAKTYVEGTDYEVDYTAGTIRRLTGSTIPDYAGHSVGTSNGLHIVWVSYTAAGSAYVPVKSALTPRFTARLAAGQSIDILALGDSITNGGETEWETAPQYWQQTYWSRWGFQIAARYGCAYTYKGEAYGGTTSSDMTYDSLLNARVTRAHDLIFVGFGMNDQASAVSKATFKANLLYGIDQIRGRYPLTEFVLVAGARPRTGGALLSDYRDAMNEIAAVRSGVFVSDVTARWDAYLVRKDSSSLLRNDINHPTQFGHSTIYIEPLAAIEPQPSVGRSWALPYAVRNVVARSWAMPYSILGAAVAEFQLLRRLVSSGFAEFPLLRRLVPVASGAITMNMQLPPGTVVGAYLTSGWRGHLVPMRRAGSYPGPVIEEEAVDANGEVTFLSLPPGEYVAWSAAFPQRRRFFVITA